MNISTQTEYLEKKLGIRKALEIIAESGFNAVDLSCFDMQRDDSPKNQADYLHYANEARHIAECEGLYFNQAHAPFPSSNGDFLTDKKIFERIVRSMEIAATVGARNIVVHPKQHLTYIDNVYKLYDMNMEFYSSLIPYCKEFGICVCVENMWQCDRVKTIQHSTCASPEEFKKYLDDIDSPFIRACLDIGHANLVGEDVPKFISTLAPYLAALHTHDAAANWDMHIMPFSVMGASFWQSVAEALKKANYEGEITLEADNTLLHAAEDMLPTASRWMAESARAIADMFEKA